MDFMMSEYQTFSCRHCKAKPSGRGKRPRPTYKRTSDEKLYQRVLDQIYKYKKENKMVVTVEKIARICQVKVHRVKKLFMKLNQEGILSQAHNAPPHDCKRDRYSFCHDSSWCASTYTILSLQSEKQNA
jgi:ribosomal protein S25